MNLPKRVRDAATPRSGTAIGQDSTAYGGVRLLTSLTPPLQQSVLDAELIADAADHEIDHVRHALRPGVEGRHCRQHDGPGLGDGRHVRSWITPSGVSRGTSMSFAVP